jgi:hypothetical protein
MAIARLLKSNLGKSMEGIGKGKVTPKQAYVALRGTLRW